ncbi:MAG: SPOR domain-containing protein [Candidatus Acidiferrales bacterium]
MVGIRQKLGLCLVLLMMSAVFFALGYWTRVLREGADRYDFHARPKTPANASGSANQPDAAAPRAKVSQTLSQGASLFPPGATLLQVAASPRESDAFALAGVLRQKGFAVLILEPTADKFYRVEVGPYTDGQSVHQAKLALNREGFQVIVKRY